MSESISYFGWRQFLKSDSTNGFLSAILFLAAASAVGVSILGLENYKEAAVCGLLCGIFGSINATISGVHHFYPLFESRKILFMLSLAMVVLWLVVVGVWAGRSAHRVKDANLRSTLGAVYLVNFCLALVAGFVNTFIFRSERKESSIISDEV